MTYNLLLHVLITRNTEHVSTELTMTNPFNSTIHSRIRDLRNLASLVFNMANTVIFFVFSEIYIKCVTQNLVSFLCLLYITIHRPVNEKGKEGTLPLLHAWLDSRSYFHKYFVSWYFKRLLVDNKFIKRVTVRHNYERNFKNKNCKVIAKGYLHFICLRYNFKEKKPSKYSK